MKNSPIEAQLRTDFTLQGEVHKVMLLTYFFFPPPHYVYIRQN